LELATARALLPLLKFCLDVMLKVKEGGLETRDCDGWYYGRASSVELYAVGMV
jgi:hypothetical protein